MSRLRLPITAGCVLLLCTPAIAPAATRAVDARVVKASGHPLKAKVSMAFARPIGRLGRHDVRVSGFRTEHVTARASRAVVSLVGRRTEARLPATAKVRLAGHWTRVVIARRPSATAAPQPTPSVPTPTPTSTPTSTATAAASPPATPASAGDAGWHVLRDPIDPDQQTDLSFCDRSHWLQPWRAYLDTRPVSALRDGLGINLNASPGQFVDAARLLAASGFRRARIEIGWDRMSYDDPTRLADPDMLTFALQELERDGIRPLILLNANHGSPGPMRRWSARVAQPAASGARTLVLDAASAAQVVPGLSGIAAEGRADDVIFTSVSGTTVTLSRPLPVDVAPGAYDATTLRFEPFGAPSSPAYEETIRGWLAYIGATTRLAHDALGSDDFDVEIWNEETFGSDFLYASRYYDPLPARFAGTGDVHDAILARSVSYLRDPAHGVSGIGIGDGFASQTPWVSGATVPTGVTALSKHPYTGPRTVFGDASPRSAGRSTRSGSRKGPRGPTGGGTPSRPPTRTTSPSTT